MRSHFKPLAICLSAAITLSACGAEKAKVEPTAASAGVQCDIGKTSSTRLSVELQECLVRAAIADFMKVAPAGTENWVVQVDGRAVNNETDQTTVNASNLASYISLQLGRVAGIKTTTEFNLGGATNVLAVTISGLRQREPGGKVSVNYGLRFNVKDLVGTTVASGQSSIKVQRGKRPLI